MCCTHLNLTPQTDSSLRSWKSLTYSTHFKYFIKPDLLWISLYFSTIIQSLLSQLILRPIPIHSHLRQFLPSGLFLCHHSTCMHRAHVRLRPWETFSGYEGVHRRLQTQNYDNINDEERFGSNCIRYRRTCDLYK